MAYDKAARVRLIFFSLFVVSQSLSVRYRGRVAYDGAAFHGFQLQLKTDRRTVQGVVENALSQRLQQQVRVVGASRTDSGVHSRGQAIHFDVESEIDDLPQVQYSVGEILPTSVVLWDLQKAPDPSIKTFNGETRLFSWNVLYESTRKYYSYRLSLASVMDPAERHRRWHPDQVHTYLGSSKQIDQLEKLLKMYQGSHDFRPFAGGMERLEKAFGGRRPNTVRTVYSVSLVDEGSLNYRIDFEIKGALYKQIRNMVGTVLDVCKGDISEERFARLLGNAHYEIDEHLSRDDNPSKPAPPEGLTLEHVYFDDF